MDYKVLVMNAIDSNGFKPSDTAAGYINPSIWNKQVYEFLTEALVVGKLADVNTELVGQAGKSIYLTIRSTPTAAAATAHSADTAVSAYAVTQVEATPTEFTKGYQLSDAEAIRAFYDVQTDMAKYLGYAMASALEDDCITTITSGAGNSVVANNVVYSNLATSDTLDQDDVINAVTEVRKDYLFPKFMVLSPGQIGQLSKSTLFVQTLPQGGNVDSILGGKIGTMYGMDVYWSTKIAASSNKTTGFVIGVDMMGKSPFVIVHKKYPTIATQYFARGRYTDIVASAEWDVVTVRANGICKLSSYEA